MNNKYYIKFLMSEASHNTVDLSTNNVIGQLELFKQNSQRLQLEAFKIDSIIHIFNNCADKCNL